MLCPPQPDDCNHMFPEEPCNCPFIILIPHPVSVCSEGTSFSDCCVQCRNSGQMMRAEETGGYSLVFGLEPRGGLAEAVWSPVTLVS